MAIDNRGFTLIELMVVVAIISILTTMAIPSFQDRAIRAQTKEAFMLARTVQDAVGDYYKAKKRLPTDNAAIGLPAPEKFVGNYVKAVSLRGGAIDITLGNRINQNVTGQVITIRPALVEDSPVVPISWVCGNASVPGGMTVVGDNFTTLQTRHLPVECIY